MATGRADFGRLRRALRREDVGLPMAMMELHVDDAVMTSIMGRPTSRRDVLSLLEFQKAMGYDYVNVYSDLVLEFRRASVGGDEGSAGGRSFVDEQQGPITTAAEFEAYPCPTRRRRRAATSPWPWPTWPRGWR